MVNATADGARLSCVFQKLEGEVTPQGLWLSSTAPGSSHTSFRVLATSLDRQQGEHRVLSFTGTVETTAGLARFIRPGLIEEYSVSVDGLRQDFLLPEQLPGRGALRVELNLFGAAAEASPDGLLLVLQDSGRKLNYHRLHATDATGRELAARMEVVSTTQLAVIVEDGGAVYPVRIDPTFSDANWTSMGGFPGVNSGVGAVAVDGLGNVYVGGSFSIAGEVFATNIAKWDGNSWSALGSGVDAPGPPFYGGAVNVLAASGTNLYVGGVFTTAGGIAANNIAKWDGSSWSALGSGLNSNVFALAVSGDDLYAGGWFTSAGGTAARNIAKWDGSSWSALGSGIAELQAEEGEELPYSSGVYALAISGTDLFVGGNFITAGGIAAANIARWDGSNWSALGAGVRDPDDFPYDLGVHALTFSGTDLYAGGRFTMAGGIAASNIARWNGSSWSSLGLGVNGRVDALAVLSGELCAGGEFNSAGGVPTSAGIAKWNGSVWSALGDGVFGNQSVGGMAVSGTSLYVGGFFTEIDGIGAWCIARWNGNNWSALGSGTEIGGGVSVLVVWEGELYAGGTFSRPGGISGIAKWEGNGWSALGTGVNGSVDALAVSGGDLYVGGFFSMAGGVPANSIAKWNGSSWSALGDGVFDGADPFGRGHVYALAVSGTSLYAAGDFFLAGNVAVGGIAKWDGSSWSALGAGVSSSFDPFFGRGIVSALALSGDDLFAGGWFTSAGGAPATNIAKWDGNSWSALGSGVDAPDPPFYGGDVLALAVSGTNLYVGGVITTAGSIAANSIAKWDGSSWSKLGMGMEDSYFPVVRALALSGSDLYAGGDFSTAGGAPAGGVAKWDGSRWTALGSGTAYGVGRTLGGVKALAVSGSDLYAGGLFHVAGGKVASFIARAYLVAPPGGVTDSVAFSSGTATIRFYGNPGHLFDVQRATDLNNWQTVSTSPLAPAPDGSFTFVDTNAPPGHAFYRAAER